MKKNLLKKLAKLSKLEISDRKLEKYSKDLSSILDYVSEISKLNLKNISPTAHAAGLENIIRKDKIKKLDCKNANSGKYFETKAIFSV